MILYCLMIFVLSSQSTPDEHLPGFLFGMGDKLLHAIEYGILGILLYRAFIQTTRPLKSMGLAILCSFIYGITDEIHQWFVPNRQTDVWDLFADTLGAALFILLWIFFKKTRQLDQTT